MNCRCPNCDRAVYNRREKVCGFCGAELPKEFQLAQAELDKLAQQDSEAEASRKIRKLKDEEDEEQRRKGDFDAESMM